MAPLNGSWMNEEPDGFRCDSVLNAVREEDSAGDSASEEVVCCQLQEDDTAHLADLIRDAKGLSCQRFMEERPDRSKMAASSDRIDSQSGPISRALIHCRYKRLRQNRAKRYSKSSYTEWFSLNGQGAVLGRQEADEAAELGLDEAICAYDLDRFARSETVPTFTWLANRRVRSALEYRRTWREEREIPIHQLSFEQKMENQGPGNEKKQSDEKLVERALAKDPRIPLQLRGPQPVEYLRDLWYGLQIRRLMIEASFTAQEQELYLLKIRAPGRRYCTQEEAAAAIGFSRPTLRSRTMEVCERMGEIDSRVKSLPRPYWFTRPPRPYTVETFAERILLTMPRWGRCPTEKGEEKRSSCWELSCPLPGYAGSLLTSHRAPDPLGVEIGRCNNPSKGSRKKSSGNEVPEFELGAEFDLAVLRWLEDPWITRPIACIAGDMDDSKRWLLEEDSDQELVDVGVPVITMLEWRRRHEPKIEVRLLQDIEGSFEGTESLTRGAVVKVGVSRAAELADEGLGQYVDPALDRLRVREVTEDMWNLGLRWIHGSHQHEEPYPWRTPNRGYECVSNDMAISDETEQFVTRLGRVVYKNLGSWSARKRQ